MMHATTKKHVVAAVVALAGFGLWAFGGALAAGEIATRLGSRESLGITVSGEGTAKALPDQAEVTLGLTAQAPTAVEAQAKNAEVMEKVIKSLTAAGVERKDIKTANYSLDATRRWDPKTGQEYLTGYQATNLVTVTTKETGKVGQLIDAAVAAGATNVQGVEFRATGGGRAREEALERAVADARRKAERMARAAGVRLGKVSAIADSTVEVPQVWRAESAQLKSAALDRQDGSASPIEPGQIRFKSNVQVVFAIR